MKAFIAAVVAIFVIGVGADMALDQAGFSVQEKYSKQDVRLDQ